MTIRHQTIFIFSLLTFISCSNNPADKLSSDSSENVIDTINPITADTIKEAQTKQIITDRFLRLVKTIDSLGFRSDTTRYKKVLSIPVYPGKSIIRVVGKYFFYEIQKEQTIPYLHNKYCETDTSRYRQEWCKKWHLNSQNLLKSETITQYFFTGGINTIDGLIEEWKFPDNNSAKLVSEDLGAKQNMVYVNRGAFVCYLDNYMYVFHSRSSSFMYSIKPFYIRFVTDNKAITTNKGSPY